ncbi:MAG: hypothetical protein AB1647_14810, partial [Pseudomonadota bacterium]
MKGALAALLLTIGLGHGAAQALDAIAMDDPHPVIDISPFVETYEADGRRLIIEPPANGMAAIGNEDAAEAGEVDHGALEDGTVVLEEGEGAGTGFWHVFALRNRGEDPLIRFLVADRRGEGLGGLFWPRPHTEFDKAVTAGGEDPVPLPGRERTGFAVFSLYGDPQNSMTVALHTMRGDGPGLYLWHEDAWTGYTQRLALVEGGMLAVIAAFAIYMAALAILTRVAAARATAALLGAGFLVLLAEFGYLAAIFSMTPWWELATRTAALAILASTIFSLERFFLESERHSALLSQIARLLSYAVLAAIPLAFL